MHFTVIDDIRFLLQPRGEDDTPPPIRSEVALWRAVIVQALMDAASRSRKPDAMYHKNEAAAWLTGGGRDFALVCEHAGFNPFYVRRMAKRAMLAGCKWRAEPGQGRQRARRGAKKTRTDEDRPAAMLLLFPALPARCTA